jgi:hypothetical protein
MVNIKTYFTKKRMVLLSVVVVISALIVSGAVLWWQYKRYEYAYASLAPHTSKIEVLKQFGKPRRIRACDGSKLSWDAEPRKVEGRCVEEYWYFSFISPEQWVIGFDEHGQAIAKHHLVSP